MMATLRSKRIWSVADFAAFLGVSHKMALATLKRLDEALGGMLLIASKGRRNRRYVFYPALLARAKPELFERVESLEGRIDILEERVGQHDADIRRTAMQVGANSRDIARIRARHLVA